MELTIEVIKERIKEKKLFKRNKIPVEIKILAGLLYYLGLSLRKTSSFLSQFGKISHESVRTYYHTIKEVLNEPERKTRNLIAIDETKLKVGDKTIYVWSAIDVETKECLGVYVSESRSSLDTISFVRSILKFCSNKPKILVDGRTWYPWALQKLGLEFERIRFGLRNCVESFFSVLKGRTKRFFNRFPMNSSFKTVVSWVKSFIMFYNWWKSLS
ncbi:IS6 family transposase [Methanotorris igneus]|uniref:Transposase, IS240 n=1 Tax=Methanotorris igneus (strain DSM 5666 / JCM 11834 / Kol 5) TaxID=880724 RepID=F6BC00_METIK|nr:IS6 family transposase [Methanotorris igneus]AEF96081.1 transposase, IS240 [Methanotorris igneus Kol 5]